MLDSRIKKIVLTGGPCAGKSTILGDIEDYLVKKGYYVITLNETATQLIKGNMPPCMDKEIVLKFQDIVLKTQLQREEAALRYAEELVPNEKVIILCDRAVMDNRAYLETQEEFDYLLKKNGVDEQQVVHSYDLVIDLISTATLKKDSYQLDGIRDESVEDAALLDKKTTLAWISHPHLITVKPTEQIEEKTAIVISEIDKYLRGVEYNNRQSILIGTNNEVSYVGQDFRNVEILNTYLKGDLVLTRKKVDDSSVLILSQYNTSFQESVISDKEAVELLCKRSIIFTEEFSETCFVENGNIYKIVNDGDKCYFEYDKTDNSLKSSSDISKKFVKRMEQC